MTNPNGFRPVRNGEPETGSPRTPEVIGNSSMKPDIPCPVTYKVFPDGATTMFSALRPIGAVTPELCRTGVKRPVLASIENTEISNDPEFATYKKLPAASIASSVGEVPVVSLGVTSVKPPVVEMV